MRSEYQGAGEAAELIARWEQMERERRFTERFDADVRMAALTESDRPLARYHRGVQAVFRAAMENAGFRQHDRGPWRRVRMASATTKKGPKKSTAVAREGPRSYSYEEMHAVLDRAQHGDETVGDELRYLMNSPQWGHGIMRAAGEPARLAVQALAQQIGGRENLAIIEATLLAFENLKRSLAPPEATPLEQLLIERVAVCWVATSAAEHRAAGRHASAREVDFLDRRLDRAHRRLLTAIRALVTLRQPDGPGVVMAVQVVNGAAKNEDAPIVEALPGR